MCKYYSTDTSNGSVHAHHTLIIPCPELQLSAPSFPDEE